MKGLPSLLIGVFGTFAFSWIGLTVVPNWQIGHLNPQSDEEGTDIYPMPKSGMAVRGEHVYIANGCFYCHSQQIRPDYAGSDIDRKWGDRRSAPRDYVFARPAVLGKTRMGPDLSNIGHRAPAEDQNAPAAGASPSASPATSTSSPAPAAGASPPAAAAAKPNASPATPAASPAEAAAAKPNASPATAAASPAVAAAKPSASPAPVAASPNPSASPNSAEAPPANGEPLPYSPAWHHKHLYSPRSITLDSNMPAYRFLYEKRRIAGEPSADALKFTGPDAPKQGWEIVPTYDAKCLVAYLMSLDQSHPLKEVKGGAPAPAASPAAAAGASPAASPAPPK